ncbi:MAG: glucose dehydrogenase [Acidobacteria bacterium]|nr:MAG: glucose dehydrogenase [Acidobacteriota bacterium]
MQAVTVRPGARDSLRVLDIPDVQSSAGQVVVKVLQGGLCGTDAEITRGLYGEAPAGSPYLVLGHENLGLVESAPGGSSLSAGDLVVSTVRRPCPDQCLPCRSGENDMCLTGHYLERGIQGLHGFMSERYVEDPQYVVAVPPGLRPVAVLVEPMTVAQKSLEQTFRIQSRMSWAPRRAAVLGAGPVGILAAAAMRIRGLEVTVASREAERSPRDTLLREAGIGYVSTSSTPISELPARLGDIDLVLEATGAAAVIAPAMSILGRNGVCVLASVTEAGRNGEIDLGAWNRQMVLGNRLIFGTVNAARRHFEAAVKDLAAAEQRLPGWMGRIITRRLPFTEAARALVRDPGDIKTVLDFG